MCRLAGLRVAVVQVRVAFVGVVEAFRTVGVTAVARALALLRNRGW